MKGTGFTAMVRRDVTLWFVNFEIRSIHGNRMEKVLKLREKKCLMHFANLPGKELQFSSRVQIITSNFKLCIFDGSLESPESAPCFHQNILRKTFLTIH